MIPTALVRRAWPLAAAFLASLAGCAAMDDFSWTQRNFEVFSTPSDPVAAARSEDANIRKRALRVLHEPMASGGSKQDQDACVTLLCHAAAADPTALCRMAAIDTLRKYQDPRAIEGLKEAYYRAGSFHGEQATVLRRLALAALGEKTQSPAAAELLVSVLREPAAEGPDVDRDSRVQERIVAARALAKFQNYQATSALVETLGKADDVGLRRVSHESLVTITHEDIPPDAKQWEDYLRRSGGRQPAPRQTWAGDGLLRAVGWK